jgi:hypothetical protein
MDRRVFCKTVAMSLLALGGTVPPMLSMNMSDSAET